MMYDNMKLTREEYLFNTELCNKIGNKTYNSEYSDYLKERQALFLRSLYKRVEHTLSLPEDEMSKSKKKLLYDAISNRLIQLIDNMYQETCNNDIHEYKTEYPFEFYHKHLLNYPADSVCLRERTILRDVFCLLQEYY